MGSGFSRWPSPSVLWITVTRYQERPPGPASSENLNESLYTHTLTLVSSCRVHGCQHKTRSGTHLWRLSHGVTFRSSVAGDKLEIAGQDLRSLWTRRGYPNVGTDILKSKIYSLTFPCSISKGRPLHHPTHHLPTLAPHPTVLVPPPHPSPLTRPPATLAPISWETPQICPIDHNQLR